MKDLVEQFRQGDVLFEEVAEIPSGAKFNNSPVLVHGELTGHAHTMVGDFERYDIEDSQDNNLLVGYIKAGKQSSVVHEDHDSHEFTSKKSYVVSRQREYDPLLSVPKIVLD